MDRDGLLVIIGILVALLVICAIGGCPSRCASQSVTTTPVTPTVPTYNTTTPVETTPLKPSEGSVVIDLTKGIVQEEKNPDNGTVTKKLVFPERVVDGDRLNLVCAERLSQAYGNKLFMRLVTELTVTRVVFEGQEVFQENQPPNFVLVFNDPQPPGNQYFYGLPLSAERGTIVIYYRQ